MNDIAWEVVERDDEGVTVTGTYRSRHVDPFNDLNPEDLPRTTNLAAWRDEAQKWARKFGACWNGDQWVIEVAATATADTEAKAQAEIERQLVDVYADSIRLEAQLTFIDRFLKARANGSRPGLACKKAEQARQTVLARL